jgi:hypothetical protein
VDTDARDVLDHARADLDQALPDRRAPLGPLEELVSHSEKLAPASR